MYLRNILLAISIFCISVSLAKALAGVSEWVDISTEGGLIRIPITVKGINTYAILDSGSQLNAISKTFRDKHNLDLTAGKSIKVVGVYGEERKRLLSGLDVNIFNTDMTLNQLVEANIADSDTAIILGASLLDNFIFQINYPNEKLRILTRDAVDLKSLENVPTQRHKNTREPLVKLTLNSDVDIWMLLDTGNSGDTVIERFIAESNGWLDGDNITVSNSLGVNTTGTLNSFVIDTLKFGPFDLENVPISVPAVGQKFNFTETESKEFSRLQGIKVRGVVGFDVLKHFLITIDYKQGDLHISLP